jgi:hypothetical protein
MSTPKSTAASILDFSLLILVKVTMTRRNMLNVSLTIAADRPKRPNSEFRILGLQEGKQRPEMELDNALLLYMEVHMLHLHLANNIL